MTHQDALNLYSASMFSKTTKHISIKYLLQIHFKTRVGTLNKVYFLFLNKLAILKLQMNKYLKYLVNRNFSKLIQ